MKEYNKIETVYERDVNGTKKLIEGKYRNEAVEFLANNKWAFTEKIDGTNIRIHWDGHRITFGGRTERSQIPSHLVNKLSEMFLNVETEELFEQKFGDGEQNLSLNLKERKICTPEQLYFWQEIKVYNHILPIIKTIAKDLDESLIYGENSLVDLLIPFQRAYNAIKNRELEYINRQSRGILCVEDGSVDVDELSEEGISGGKIIVYRQGSTPPKFELNHIDTKPYIDSEENILKEMYNLAKLYCKRLKGE